jgi:lysophospholipase L1-like esterase
LFAREISDPYCEWSTEAAALARSAPWRRVVAVGDSVAAGVLEPLDGYRELDGIARVAEVLTAAHPSCRYSNLGERDLRAAEIRERQVPLALELDPDLVVLAAGGDDAVRRSFDGPQIERELTLLVEPLVAQGAQLVVIGLFDLARSGLVPDRYADTMAERFDALDAITARVAAKHGGVQVENHHHPLAADPSIFASDRIHANARGHAISAAGFARALVALLPPSS